MTGQLQGIAGKDHRPGHIRRPPPELLPDKVTEATQGHAQRREDRDEIEHGPESDALATGVEPGGDDHPEHAAVEGHAPLPDPQQPARVLANPAQAVEQYVAETAAKHHAEGAVKDQVVDLFAPERRIGPIAAPACEPPGEGEPGEIGQSVPVHLERPQGKRDGVDGGVGEHGGRAGRGRGTCCRLFSSRGEARIIGQRLHGHKPVPGAGRPRNPSGPAVRPMCLITFAWRVHPQAPLLLAANRDEFYRRPSAPLARWGDAPRVIAGRDLEAAGTWLGISDRGRFAAVTNIRDPAAVARRAARSRGELTADFLRGDEAPGAYLATVAARCADYQGFNLLLGDGDELWYLHGDGSRGATPRPLEPGIYGLSNAALDVPWPKVERARRALSEAVAPAAPADHPALAACIDSRELAEEAELHGHGLEGEMARRLSAQFIVTETYGTRCQTTLRRLADGRFDIRECRFDGRGNLEGETRLELSIAAP